jgi:hypothetical protein
VRGRLVAENIFKVKQVHGNEMKHQSFCLRSLPAANVEQGKCRAVAHRDALSRCGD